VRTISPGGRTRFRPPGLRSPAPWCAAALLAALVPASAAALEPRYDHRDTQGILVEPMTAYDTVAISGRPTHSSWRTGMRLAYGWDVLGEGNELFLGAQTAFSWSDPERHKLRLALDARYRAYFGTERWKTFFELGLWAPVSSRLAIGPLVTIGVAYDFSRWTGVYASAGFQTAIGQARIASFPVSAGVQVRF
jgi:hypothetical protein